MAKKIKKVKIKEAGIVIPEEEPMYLSRTNQDEVEWDNEDKVDYKVVFVKNDSPFTNKGLTVPAPGPSRSGTIDSAAQEYKEYVYYLVPVLSSCIEEPVTAGAVDPKIIITG